MWARVRIGALARLGEIFTRTVAATHRWEWEWLLKDDSLGLNTPPAILAFWHGRQLTLPWVYRRFRGLDRSKNLSVLSSLHADGQIAARLVRAYGLESVGGSSTRGGVSALRNLIRVIRSGNDVGITPDGPKGPRRTVASKGVLELARVTGAPIFPIAYSANRLWKVRSWDRVIFPKPFARVVGVCGEPIFIPRDAGEEELAAFAETLRAKLNEVTDYADECAGVDVGDRVLDAPQVPLVNVGR